MHLQMYHNTSSRTHHDTPTSPYCCLMQLEPSHSGNMWVIFSRTHMLASHCCVSANPHMCKKWSLDFRSFFFFFLCLSLSFFFFFYIFFAMCGQHYDNHQLKHILCLCVFFAAGHRKLDKEPARVSVSTQQPLSPFTFFFLKVWLRKEASLNLTTCHTGNSLCLSRLQVQRYGSFPKETNGGCIAVCPNHEPSTVIRQWRSSHTHRSSSDLVALYTNIWAATVHLHRGIIAVVLVVLSLCASYLCSLYFIVFYHCCKVLCNASMKCVLEIKLPAYLYWDTTWNSSKII